MAEHYFKPVARHTKATTTHDVWRCDKCDSEALFHKGMREKDVNQLMIIRLPCMPKTAN